MAKPSVPRKARPTKGARKPLTLAHIAQVTHPVGPKPLTISGEQIAQLIDAAKPLYGQDADWDFLNHHAIAIELRDMAEVFVELMDDSRPNALGYFADQLRRLSNRVAAIAPRSGNGEPSWYTVEVTK